MSKVRSLQGAVGTWLGLPVLFSPVVYNMSWILLIHRYIVHEIRRAVLNSIAKLLQWRRVRGFPTFCGVLCCMQFSKTYSFCM